MISVLVANSKGGCGKTTIATNLAAAFAAGGLPTVLADTDRQRSSLGWLQSRPDTAAPITGVDWVKSPKKPPKRTERLIIDSPAAVTGKDAKELVAMADVIVVPVLASAFDQGATREFLDKVRQLKAIRKNRKPLALVRNRVRSGSRAAARLDMFLMELETRDVGWLPDRAIYNEMAWRGMSIFDLDSLQAETLQRDWVPLIRYIENEGFAFEDESLEQGQA